MGSWEEQDQGNQAWFSWIPRLYDVESGRVTVAGHDVKEYDLDSLRKQVAMVLPDQCPFLVRLKKYALGK